jgi:polygalacturonase
LIAGLDDAHRTEVTLDGVQIEGIAPTQVHGRFATVTKGPQGFNLDFSGTDIKVVSADRVGVGAAKTAFSCAEKFVPME